MTDATAKIVVPLVEEVAGVVVLPKVTGGVRIETRTEERTEQVGVVLQHQDVEIVRVVIDRPVAAMPDIRQEGDFTVIPVVEEVVVVERRLILKEEIRVRQVTRTEERPEQVTLRSQHADIRRLPAE